jgi:hypothetical protein
VFRALVIILIVAIVVFVARRIWVAVLQLRVGAIPDDVDVPEVDLQADRGWQITREVRAHIATVNVEHPSEGVMRTWQVPLRDPGARMALADVMRRAGELAQELAAADRR